MGRNNSEQSHNGQWLSIGICVRSLLTAILRAVKRMKPPVQFSPIILVLVFFLDGCAAFAPMNEFYGTPNELTNNDKSVKELPQLPKEPVASKPVATASFPREKGDMERLAQLWEARSRGISTADYPVGPGDVVEISVPAIEELRGRVVRISGDGIIVVS